MKSCKCRKVEQAAEAGTLNLLAVAFTENDAPGGVVILTFSGGAALRLEVECLEAELADLGPCLGAGDAARPILRPRPFRRDLAEQPRTAQTGLTRPAAAVPFDR